MSDIKKMKKILVIDDDADTVIYLETLLRDNGYETISASNGIAGMDKVKSEHPELVVLDVSMPQQSGMGFYRDIKADAKLTAIPVIIVTGVTGYGGDDQAIKKFIEGRRTIAPPDGYFAKPIDRDAFLKKVGEILG
jgi:CheY-like chemotaxis protein